MKVVIIAGFVMIVAAVGGIIWEMAYLGGSNPRLATSLETRGNLMAALSVIGILGIASVLLGVWRLDRRP